MLFVLPWMTREQGKLQFSKVILRNTYFCVHTAIPNPDFKDMWVFLVVLLVFP